MKKDTISKTSTYEVQLETLKSELSKLPKEKICAHKRGKRYDYYVRSVDADGKRHEKYMSYNNTEQLAAYCRAAYLRKLISALEKEVKCLRIFERNYNPQAKYDAWIYLPEGYKRFVKPQFKSNEQICREWESASFNTNTFPFTEDKRYLTKKGEYVRSRIELIVANILYDLHISYRYECELKLHSTTIYPDFTMIHPETLELYYLEIFGMMDNPEYEAAAFKKIAKYATSDAYPRLIMFFDHKNARISPEDIKNTLEKIFCTISSGPFFS